MNFQYIFPSISETTVLTLEWLVTSMLSTYMILQMALGCEALAALTQMRLHPLMTVLMIF